MFSQVMLLCRPFKVMPCMLMGVQVRMRVNSLGRAFGRRSEEHQSSARAHQISLGTFALESALSQVWSHVPLGWLSRGRAKVNAEGPLEEPVTSARQCIC